MRNSECGMGNKKKRPVASCQLPVAGFLIYVFTGNREPGTGDEFYGCFINLRHLSTL